MTRPAWIAWLGGACLVLGACGAGNPGSSVPDPATPSTPVGSESASPAPAACPNFVEVVETEPMPTDFTDDGPVAREHQRLRHDGELIRTYAGQHADEFASMRFENGPRVRLVVGFTAHIAGHCAALRAILAFPDEFQIIEQPVTAKQLDVIMADVVEMAGRHLVGGGELSGSLDLQLRADGEAVAEQIAAKYGALVDITVGMLPYPDRFAETAVRCLLGLPIDPDRTLVAKVTLDVASVPLGADFGGHVRVSNTGPKTVTFETGTEMGAVVFRAGTTEPVGFYTGAFGDVGAGGELGPGNTLELTVFGGTASCDPALGYAVPPGVYDVRVPVDRYQDAGGPDLQVTSVLSDPVPLTILP